MRWLFGVLLGVCVCNFGVAQELLSGSSLIDVLRGGGVAVLMRHASTEPGVGDPPNFKLGDCRTQRNLSAKGRIEASSLGHRLRLAGISPGLVYSSEWCRCSETAMLAFGRSEAWPVLNSFFSIPDSGAAQTAALKERIRLLRPGEPPLVLVTHQVNITALTGIYPMPGQIVVVAFGADRLRVLGSLTP